MAKRLTPVARKLRRERTEVEDRLWQRLRNRQVEGAKFRFQRPVSGSVADFACDEVKLIVELDGGQHADQAEADRVRALSLEQAGYVVLRFWNSDVTGNLDGVLEEIRRTVLIARGL
jgi:very-short-patch-repair endonuclease